MARLAEVSVAPAEPLRNRAAEFALELDKVGAVLRAGRDARADGDGSALAADELLLLPVLIIILVACIARATATLLHAAEVGVAALEAHVVGELLHRVLLQLVVVVATGLDARVLVHVLELGSLQCHLDDFLFEGQLLVDDLLQRRTLLAAEVLLARRALHVVEGHTWTVPLLLHHLLNAGAVEHVTAVEHDGRLLADRASVANRAEVFAVSFWL